MTNITFDQLIADLCVCRGKEPKMGTYFIVDTTVFDGTWTLTLTNGKEKYRIEIVGGHEEGNEFEAVAISQK